MADQSVCDLILNGKFDELKKKISQNRDLINKTDESGRLPLHWAVSQGHEEITDYLLDLGASVDARDQSGWTPLMIAVSAGRSKIVNTLIHRYAQVNAVNHNGQCSLHYAASKNRFEIVECLLNNNCDPDTADWMGSTPMHRAASKGHHKVVELLLQFQAQIDCADKEGNTPFKACEGTKLKKIPFHFLNNPKVIQLIRNSADNTPLHLACEEERGDVAHLLVQKGASLSLLNKEEKSPLDLAPPKLGRNLKNLSERGN